MSLFNRKTERKRQRSPPGPSSPNVCSKRTCLNTFGYGSLLKSCDNQCCEFMLWQSLRSPSSTKNSGELRLRNGCSGSDLEGKSCKEIIRLLIDKNKILKTPEGKVLHLLKNLNQNSLGVQKDSTSNSNGRYDFYFTPRRNIQINDHPVCLKSFITSSQDTFLTALTADSSNDASVESDSLSESLPGSNSPEDETTEETEVDVNFCRNKATFFMTITKTGHTSAGKGVIKTRVQSNSEEETDSDTSINLNNSELPVARRCIAVSKFYLGCVSRESALLNLRSSVRSKEDTETSAPSAASLESLPGSLSKQCEIPFLTIKQGRSETHPSSLGTVTKLFACDFYRLQKTPRKNYFDFHGKIVHKVDIFGTITKILPLQESRIVYHIDDGTASISCIIDRTENLAKKRECTAKLDLSNAPEPLPKQQSCHANKSKSRLLSAVTGMRSVLKGNLKSEVDINNLKLGDTVHGVGVLYDHGAEKNMYLNKIWQVTTEHEIEDRLHQIIFLYEEVYPKLIKDFKNSPALASL
ncbi:unnamed protein product [Bemisia tabaci]|uniref:Uncharacterized protein n=1 Tax=Bemisia tabaci TaxID=7038 RepID=A0A9P0A337_BEMTA|nr:unnamed protein product [Bemisia tabaci]